MRLEELVENDRNHFLSRLARFGVDQQQLRDEELVVRKDTRLQAVSDGRVAVALLGLGVDHGGRPRLNVYLKCSR